MPDLSSTFEPMNELEQALAQAQAGRMEVTAFMHHLLASPVFVLIDKDLDAQGRWDDAATPLILGSSSGNSVLVIFTSPERSGGWPERHPQFRFGLFVDFRWLLEGVADGVGIIINPGSAVGLEVPPSGVDQLKLDARMTPAIPARHQ